MGKVQFTKELLYDLYITNGLGVTEIAKQYRVSTTRLTRLLREYDIPTGKQRKEILNELGFSTPKKIRKIAKVEVNTRIIDGHEIQVKLCTGCMEEKPLTEFHKNKTNPTGRSSKCRSCMGSTRRRTIAEIVTITVNGKEVKAKRCSACMVVKPLDDFKKQATAVGGKESKCKACKSTAKHEFEIKEITIENEQILARRCICCKQDKPLYEFGVRKRSKDGYNFKCKQCRQPAVLKARQRGQEYTKEHHEQELQRRAEYRKQDPEWYIKRNTYDITRRAMKRYLPSELTPQQCKQFVFEKFGFKCSVTGSTNVHIDHFIPLSWGHGGTYIGNLYLLDKSFNVRKNDLNPFEFFDELVGNGLISGSRVSRLFEEIASQNSVSVDEMRHFVDWCEINKRTVEEVKESDGTHSIDLWRKEMSPKK